MTSMDTKFLPIHSNRFHTAETVAQLEIEYDKVCLAQLRAAMAKDFVEVDRLRERLTYLITALGVELVKL